MERWPHQVRARQAVVDAIGDAKRRILLTIPTGGGKTLVGLDVAQEFTERGLGVVFYSNRKLLLEQQSRVLEAAGVSHGIRAAGHDTDSTQLFQVSSIQTEDSRVSRKGTWELHKAHLVIIDEAHLQTGATVQKLMDKHVEGGAVILGLTATPIDLAGYYEHLITAGKLSELRQCGALVAARHFAPDEPDLAEWKKKGKLKGWTLGEDMSENQIKKVMMTAGIFGRVLEWFDRINPFRAASILFAPGVQESLWFAEQFVAAGISAAHIDGQDCWINGKMYRSSPEARADCLEGSKNGTIRVLCNRFVLREGIDAPWLSHGIFATVFGSLQSYLQSGGRLLRAHSSLSSVTIQDHGGNWHRHGSLNADRVWRLEYTGSIISGMREERLRGKKCWKCKAKLLPHRVQCPECGALNETEPCVCPKCFQVITGPVCPCGWEAGGKQSRPVVQSDGTLRDMAGDIYKPRTIMKQTRGRDIWKKMYYRSCTDKGSRTFRAAFALFAQENHWQWPDPTWPLMPTNLYDQFRLVKDVPKESLVPE